VIVSVVAWVVRLYSLLRCGGDYEEWRLLGCYTAMALVKTDILEELSASFIRVTRIGASFIRVTRIGISFIRVTRIGELGTMLAVTSN
jgi:hypothetical protein